MAKETDNTLTYIIVALLILCALTLSSIDGELKSQRTPEQIEAIHKQEQIEANAEAIMRAEQDRNESRLREMSWMDVSSIGEFMLKFIAHGYHIWLLIIAVVFSGPALMRRSQRGY
mgnify:CR=1 FL=1